jgi:hypothetical protein
LGGAPLVWSICLRVASAKSLVALMLWAFTDWGRAPGARHGVVAIFFSRTIGRE